jgi:hypothetical protein
MAERREQEVDVAIAELTGSYWGLLTGKKGKKAIDLDNWREPNWPAVKMCVAAGYPEEHKEIRTIADREKIAAPMLSITAEVAGPLGRDQRIITLSSRLDEPHGSVAARSTRPKTVWCLPGSCSGATQVQKWRRRAV